MKLLISAMFIMFISWFSGVVIPADERVVDASGEPVGGGCQQHIPVPTTRYPDNELNLLVWNVQKHNSGAWQSEFQALAQAADLVLLQEAKFPLQQALSDWPWQQTWAFSLNGQRLGVASALHQLPLSSCGQWHTEPWLGTDKTALVSSLLIPSGETLLVINLHGVNFSWDMQPYQQQLEPLLQMLREHSGPVLFGGDFNSWRGLRQSYLSHAMQQLGMQAVSFSPDLRTRFFGQPLDHIFYRGVKFVQAQTFPTNNSDHAPLLAKFVIE